MLDQSTVTHDIIFKTVCVRPPCTNVYHIKTMCDGQPLQHSFFYDLMGKIACDVPMNEKVFLGATVCDVHDRW